MKNLFTVVVFGLASISANADWQYSQITDDMTSKISETARIESENSLDLPHPYQGKNYGSLIVLKDKRVGSGFGFSIEKGQIICDAYRGCDVAFRFDDAQPIKFHTTRSEDYSSTFLAFRDGQRFIAAASKAKKILVQVTMFQSGSQILEFKTAKPLEWKAKNR
jgi:hypothetical protein